MSKEHKYYLTIEWTGNTGVGTLNYRSYDRNHKIKATEKHEIWASADPSFRGDKSKYNPEELLVASISGCHMLWFLHLCADEGIVVTDYIDTPVGIMIESESGGGRFKEVILNPVVTIKNSMDSYLLENIHSKANQLCFIANSLNFKVKHNASYKFGIS
jgi:organic hydroperoxide reductase OsmC/OhrA